MHTLDHAPLTLQGPCAAGDPRHALVAGFTPADARRVAPDVGDVMTAWEAPAAALLRSPARFRGSGLNAARAAVARELVVEAACLALARAREIHYTRGPSRWQGLDRGLRAWRGEFPRYADCSGFATWVLRQGLAPFGVGDVVNGTNWQAGYVVTLLEHGRPLGPSDGIRVGDLAFYVPDDRSSHHVAVCLGGGTVISHGSDDGPLLLDLDYRPDLRSIRRYL